MGENLKLFRYLTFIIIDTPHPVIHVMMYLYNT
jgi:hypothetical protein